MSSLSSGEGKRRARLHPLDETTKSITVDLLLRDTHVWIWILTGRALRRAPRALCSPAPNRAAQSRIFTGHALRGHGASRGRPPAAHPPSRRMDPSGHGLGARADRGAVTVDRYRRGAHSARRAGGPPGSLSG